MFLTNYSISDALVFVLTLTRILAMFLTLPKLATDVYFLFFRLLFAVVLSLVVAPLVTPAEPLHTDLGMHEFLMLFIGETGIGLCLGLSASCVILGLFAAGQIASQLLGFQIGSLQQGLGADASADYRKLFYAIGLFSWFAISGHRFAVEGLLTSFAQFSPGEFHFSGHMLELVNRLIHTTLVFAMQFSLPILVVSIFGFLIAGFFSRVIGSGQSTAVAFGLNQVLFFLIAVPLVIVYSEETFEHATGQIEQLINSFTKFERH